MVSCNGRILLRIDISGVSDYRGIENRCSAHKKPFLSL